MPYEIKDDKQWVIEEYNGRCTTCLTKTNPDDYYSNWTGYRIIDGETIHGTFDYFGNLLPFEDYTCNNGGYDYTRRTGINRKFESSESNDSLLIINLACKILDGIDYLKEKHKEKKMTNRLSESLHYLEYGKTIYKKMWEGVVYNKQEKWIVAGLIDRKRWLIAEGFAIREDKIISQYKHFKVLKSISLEDIRSNKCFKEFLDKCKDKIEYKDFFVLCENGNKDWCFKGLEKKKPNEQSQSNNLDYEKGMIMLQKGDLEGAYLYLKSASINCDLKGLDLFELRNKIEEKLPKANMTLDQIKAIATDLFWGQNGQIKDYKKAFLYYKIAATRGDCYSIGMVANYYQNGCGTDIDLETALYWYLLLDKFKWESASLYYYDIAVIYEDFYNDFASAKVYYQKSFEITGNKEAKKRLKRIKEY